MSPDPLHGWGLCTRLLGTRPHMVNVDEVGIDKVGRYPLQIMVVMKQFHVCLLRRNVW